MPFLFQLPELTITSDSFLITTETWRAAHGEKKRPATPGDFFLRLAQQFEKKQTNRLQHTCPAFLKYNCASDSFSFCKYRAVSFFLYTARLYFFYKYCAGLYFFYKSHTHSFYLNDSCSQHVTPVLFFHLYFAVSSSCSLNTASWNCISQPLPLCFFFTPQPMCIFPVPTPGHPAIWPPAFALPLASGLL